MNQRVTNDHSASPVRQRWSYGLWALLTAGVGLASRRVPGLPAWVTLYAGDALWALLVFWLVSWLRPRWRPGRRAAVAGALALLVEVSQLYHAPWLNALRESTLGALVLGRGFLWSDVGCYAAGVALGYGLERLRRRFG